MKFHFWKFSMGVHLNYQEGLLDFTQSMMEDSIYVVKKFLTNLYWILIYLFFIHIYLL